MERIRAGGGFSYPLHNYHAIFIRADSLPGEGLHWESRRCTMMWLEPAGRDDSALRVERHAVFPSGVQVPIE